MVMSKKTRVLFDSIDGPKMGALRLKGQIYKPETARGFFPFHNR